MNQAINIYQHHGIVVGRQEIDHGNKLLLNYIETEKYYMKMADENFAELINLIINHDYYYRMSDDQRWWDQGYNEEKRMKHLLKNFVWEDIEPYVDNAHKDYVKRLF